MFQKAGENPGQIPEDSAEKVVEQDDSLKELEILIEKLKAEEKEEVHRESMDRIVALKKQLSADQQQELLKMIDNHKEEINDYEALIRLGEIEDELRENQSEEEEGNQDDEQRSEQPEEAKEAQIVSDVIKNDTQKKKGFFEGVKSTLKGFGIGALGPVIKSFISIARSVINVFPGQDKDKMVARLKTIEGWRVKLFGIDEAQDMVKAVLNKKNSKMLIVDGSDDKLAYFSLKEQWQKILDQELKGATSEGLKEAISEKNTLEVFVHEKTEKYIEKYASFLNSERGSDKTVVTTLKGIADGLKPVEQAKSELATKNDDGDDKEKTARKFNLFSFLGFG